MVALTIALAAVVGVLLGLLGGGGSVLAVPLLVFVAGLDPHSAAAMSLFVVGTTSLAGLVPHARAGRVRWLSGLAFGAAGMVGAYLGGQVAGYVPGAVLLGAFSVLMILTAVAMIRGRRAPSAAGDAAGRMWWRLSPIGFAVGLLTGFVGAGGGFLVVPALVLLSGLPMAEAVGTSLLVIVMQATSGLAGHLVGDPAGAAIDWGLALAVAASAVAGSLIGSRMTGRFDQELMRRAFGWFVLTMGFVILARQLPGTAAGWAVLVVLVLAALAVAITVALRRSGRAAPEGASPVAPPPLIVASAVPRGRGMSDFGSS